jgi:hypothetical protein
MVERGNENVMVFEKTAKQNKMRKSGNRCGLIEPRVRQKGQGAGGTGAAGC